MWILKVEKITCARYHRINKISPNTWWSSSPMCTPRILFYKKTFLWRSLCLNVQITNISERFCNKNRNLLFSCCSVTLHVHHHLTRASFWDCIFNYLTLVMVLLVSWYRSSSSVLSCDVLCCEGKWIWTLPWIVCINAIPCVGVDIRVCT